MILIRGADQIRRINDPDIRRLVERRFVEVCAGEPYVPEVHGEMILAQPGDTLASLEEQGDLALASSPVDELFFPDPDFVPFCETIEEHPGCYEMVFIMSDDGYGVLIFVPDQPDIDRELLSLCRTHAVKPRKRRRS
jgi:hypothetical protein